MIPVSTSTYQVGKPVKTDDILPYTMLITPDGKTLYVGDWGSGTVTPIRTAANTAGRPIKTGANPFAIAMAVTPNGKILYVLCAGFPGPQDIVPVNTATNTAGPPINTGLQPTAIAIPGGHRH